jgi:NDP-sugar pyrophosphorylase family protein
MDLMKSKFKSPLIAPFASARESIRYGANVNVHPSAVITPPVLVDSGCVIGKGVRLTGPVVMGHGCRLDDGAVVENAILWDNITIGANASLSNCIVSSRAIIRANQEVNNCIVTTANTVPLVR